MLLDRPPQLAVAQLAEAVAAAREPCAVRLCSVAVQGAAHAAPWTMETRRQPAQVQFAISASTTARRVCRSSSAASCAPTSA